jgi:5-deoxy-D-glucuronate isomerase
VHLVSPEGRVHVPRAPLAPPPAELAGLRIAVLDNGKPNAVLLMTEIARRVAARNDARLALVVAKGTAATPAEPEILQQLEAADLVVTGSAD